MHSTREMLSQCDATCSCVVGNGLVVKQTLCVICCYGVCVQVAAAGIVVIREGKECPGVLLYGISRGVALTSDGGNESAIGVDTQFELFVAVAVGKDVTGIGHANPDITREVFPC